LIFVDIVKKSFFQFYDRVLGDLPEIIWKHSKPTFDSSVEFGYKILGLLVGWMALLLVIELFVRLFLLIIGYLLRLVMPKKAKTEKPIITTEERPESVNADDEN
jgi:hypothetical protein